MLFFSAKYKQVDPLKHHGIIDPLIKGKHQPINDNDTAALKTWIENAAALDKRLVTAITIGVNSWVSRNPQEQDTYNFLDDMDKGAARQMKALMSHEALAKRTVDERTNHAQKGVKQVLYLAQQLLTGAISYIEFIDHYEKSGVALYFDHIPDLNAVLRDVVNHALSTPEKQVQAKDFYVAMHYPLEKEHQDLSAALEQGWKSRVGMRDPSTLDRAIFAVYQTGDQLLKKKCTIDDFNKVVAAYKSINAKPNPTIDTLVNRAQNYSTGEALLVSKIQVLEQQKRAPVKTSTPRPPRPSSTKF